MGDTVVQQNVKKVFSKTESEGQTKERSQAQMTKGLKGGEDRWRDNGG